MNNKNLKEITIDGFKSIRSQVVAIGDMNVLIGQNGAGKSNFIGVFKFIRNIIIGRLKSVSIREGAENILYYGSKETKSINLFLDFYPNSYQINLLPTLNDSLIIDSEKCGFTAEDYKNPYFTTITFSEEESKLSAKALSDKVANHVYDVLKDWIVYHFHDTSETAGIKKYASLADDKFLFDDASNLAPFLFRMKNTDKKHYDRIIKTIQLVIPFFKDFVLSPNPLNPENIRLEWNDVFSDKTFTANQLSDGSLRFICMATLLLQSKLPKLVIIDEPELGLHPTAITILAGLLKKASTRTQVIISTQSVSLVNEFEPDDIIVVEKDNSETVFRRLDSEKLDSWLESYSLGDLWDKNVIGGNP